MKRQPTNNRTKRTARRIARNLITIGLLTGFISVGAELFRNVSETEVLYHDNADIPAKNYPVYMHDGELIVKYDRTATKQTTTHNFLSNGAEPVTAEEYTLIGRYTQNGIESEYIKTSELEIDGIQSDEIQPQGIAQELTEDATQGTTSQEDAPKASQKLTYEKPKANAGGKRFVYASEITADKTQTVAEYIRGKVIQYGLNNAPPNSIAFYSNGYAFISSGDYFGMRTDKERMLYNADGEKVGAIPSGGYIFVTESRDMVTGENSRGLLRIAGYTFGRLETLKTGVYFIGYE